MYYQISSIVLGVTILLVGLSIYGNSLLQDSIARACLATTRAEGSATHVLDTVGLTRDVMEVYDSLTPEQRSKTGTEEYRQLFQAVDSIGGPDSLVTWLGKVVNNYITDVSRIYVCAYDAEHNAIVYIVDTGTAPDSDNHAWTGDWEHIPDG